MLLRILLIYVLEFQCATHAAFNGMQFLKCSRKLDFFHDICIWIFRCESKICKFYKCYVRTFWFSLSILVLNFSLEILLWEFFLRDAYRNLEIVSRNFKILFAPILTHLHQRFLQKSSFVKGIIEFLVF